MDNQISLEIVILETEEKKASFMENEAQNLDD